MLIVLPETIQHQWMVEMMRRFNLYFSLFNDSRYAETKLDSSNLFEIEQRVICLLEVSCAIISSVWESWWTLSEIYWWLMKPTTWDGMKKHQAANTK